MRNIVKRITVMTIIASLLFANNICHVSAKSEDSKSKKQIFQISPYETIDISSLDEKGFVTRNKTTHPSENEIAVTTTQYYIDDINNRNRIRDKITNELSEVDEMQALEEHYQYDEDLDETMSYLQFITVYWHTYEENGTLFGKVWQVDGGYEQHDANVTVVSQYVCAGQCYGFDSDSYDVYITPANSNWSVNTYDKFNYLPISSSSSYSCGGAYYDLEIVRRAGSWTNEILTTGWDYGAVSLSDFFGR
jgi:hypothetical protein